MTTGRMDPAGRARAPAAAGEQQFADALGGPDGTGDPSVLMPVLQVYPDALSAPMPDAMVPLPPLDPAALAVAAGMPTPPLTPAQARVAAQRAAERAAAARREAQPVRSQVPSAQRRPSPPTPRAAPSAWGNLEPHSAVAPHLQGPRQPGTNQVPTPPASSAWTGRTMSPTEVAGFLRSTLSGITHGANPAISQFQPAPHAPTPPLPRSTQRRRNKGSSVWAVLVFLVVVAFASGIAQQIISAVSELFNR